jgi:hypothetical protein
VLAKGVFVGASPCSRMLAKPLCLVKRKCPSHHSAAGAASHGEMQMPSQVFVKPSPCSLSGLCRTESLLAYEVFVGASPCSRRGS